MRRHEHEVTTAQLHANAPHARTPATREGRRGTCGLPGVRPYSVAALPRGPRAE